MTRYFRLFLWHRYPYPSYKPFGSDVLAATGSAYKQGHVYRIRLIGSTDDTATWPEFVVIKTVSRIEQQPRIVEVYLVLLSEQEAFVEPFADWELN